MPDSFSKDHILLQAGLEGAEGFAQIDSRQLHRAAGASRASIRMRRLISS